MTTVSVGTKSISAATGQGGHKDSLGDGTLPTVLLLHGAGMDRTVWSLQTRWLAHHGCSPLAVDLPGHGASTEPPCGSIAAYAEWVADLARHITGPVHLVGHSMGTYIALESANLAPVASLTLIGTAATMPVHPALIDAAAANDPLAARLMSGWAFAPTSRTGAHPSPGSSMVGGTQAMIGQCQPGVLHADLAMCAEYQRAVAAAESVSAPTTFLLGQVDRMTPVRGAQPLIDAMNAPTVEVVPKVGHMIQVEAPQATRAAIQTRVTPGR